jgi:hypothetical protein
MPICLGDRWLRHRSALGRKLMVGGHVPPPGGSWVSIIRWLDRGRGRFGRRGRRGAWRTGELLVQPPQVRPWLPALWAGVLQAPDLGIPDDLGALVQVQQWVAPDLEDQAFGDDPVRVYVASAENTPSVR